VIGCHTLTVGQIRRTVRRAPEVIVKVLPRGRHDVAAAAAHLAYISRQGSLQVTTDEGERVAGAEATAQLLDRWGLELEAERPGVDLQAFSRRKAPKLFHKVTFSMPPGTPAAKVLGAVQGFAREELALTHRYAMVLHTDEPHPHVHLIIKSLSEQGRVCTSRRRRSGTGGGDLRSSWKPAECPPMRRRGP
jgi:hypothetical protein